MRASRKALCAAALTWGVLFFHCSSDLALDTSGSETGNARAMGRIVDSSGVPVANVRVRFIPANLNPLTADYTEVRAYTTGDDGTFSLGITKGGLYNLYARDSAGVLQRLIPGISINHDSVLLDDCRLRETSTATVFLSDSLSASAAHCYLPGTPFYRKKPAGGRTVTFTDIPAGVLPPAFILFNDSSPAALSDTLVTIENSRMRATAILVVDEPRLLPSESILLRRMVDSLCIRTTAIADENIRLGDANTVELVFVASSADASTLRSTLRDAATAIVSSEQALYPFMGMASSAGDTIGRNSLVITNTTHPVSEGLPDTVTATSIATYYGWGAPSGEVHIIAVDRDDPRKAFVFCYEQGALLSSGAAAPGRRGGLFMNRKATRNLTAHGWKIFDQMLLWAIR